MGNTDPWQQFIVGQTPNATSPDPWAQYIQKPAQSTPDESALPTQAKDPWSAYLVGPANSTNPTTKTGAEPDESSTWYGKAWDWLNKPLLDLHGNGATGFEAGAEDVLSGLTSPLSIGLTLGTLGGGAVESLGGAALRSLGVSSKAAPLVMQGLKFLTEAGFTTQQISGLVQESPRLLDALKEGDYETAKRLAVHVATNAGLAAVGVRKAIPEAGALAERVGVIKPNEELSAVRGEFGKYQLQIEKAASDADKLVDSARTQLDPDGKLGKRDREVLQGAISRYIEAGGDKDLLAKRQAALESSTAVSDSHSTKDRQLLLDKYAKAQQLTPEQEDFASRVRASFDQDLERGYQRGIIRDAVNNYISHIWEDDPTNQATNRVRYQTNSGAFDTNLSAARSRTLDTMFDGEMLGKKLKSDDPVALMANYRYSLDRAIAARDFLERLQDKDLRAPDGRAIVAASGQGQVIGEDNPSVLINPKAARSIRIAQSIVDGLRDSGQLSQFVDSGKLRQLGTSSIRIADDVSEQLYKDPALLAQKIAAGEIKKTPDGSLYGVRPVYGWQTGDYRVIDHPAFRDWNFAATGPDETPIYVKGDLRVHPAAADFIQRAVGADPSPIRDFKIGDVPVGKNFLNLSSQGKHLLLSLSPFHLAQEGLRAVMTGINPFRQTGLRPQQRQRVAIWRRARTDAQRFATQPSGLYRGRCFTLGDHFQNPRNRRVAG